MKNTIILFIALLTLSIGACKKKPSSTRCYICERYELQYAPIFEWMGKPRQLVAVDTVCNMNEGRIAQYSKEHTYPDTVYRGTHNDTIVVVIHSSICDVE